MPRTHQTNLEPIQPEEAKELYLSQRADEVSESTIQAHHYRLSHFVQWCDEVAEIDNMNILSGRDLQHYKMWRRDDGDLNNVTMVTQLSTLRVFINWCENIDGVASGTHDKILMPSLAKNEDRRTAMLSNDAASRLIEFLREYKRASREHALVEVLWHTGMRIGAAHSLDVEDYDADGQYVELHHRPDTETRLKNREEGERHVSLSAEICDILDSYIKYKREDAADMFGRNPLFSTPHGRPAKSTLRDNIYQTTRPCEYTGECPHNREIATCEAMDRNKASKCPSSVSPHAIRRGSITHHLSEDVPEKVVSDRMNVSLDVLEKHYDRRGNREKAEQRRDYLENI
ncbi:Phage integrase, N-terminal SAM-like domain [Halopelagius inordinatus]|uniref:Phage integrase, N-terminal SAM-like domain n=1 Tax=Halopelagius inordinatus TaxID=553467 RepID=A0A1I2M282_9EURY|nr:site-specific integrase [Halopelagius inordinatus]SFF83536.1 Phage integrase, N-terminal SAM-like domain [Halopelagius inordinatus]